ncbi:uncharacterized protein C19orf85 homolog [Pyxicephalus adspersus]|uniref:uncharacterized protein C19orf85 homolog n=1 Tax=Pyxicephalus adspersus TaxID=30357 RepID=UPI003B5C841F
MYLQLTDIKTLLQIFPLQPLIIMHHRSPQFAFNLYPRPEMGYYECGRDLFTFVTVASSHIMRTLQRPKKSRPTKRKVNHRRFLQNQICRKYAIIEAATHQLATSIFSQEAAVEKETTNKNIDSTASENRSDTPKNIRKGRVLPNTFNISTNLSELPEVCLGDSAFLGVAEAFLVPDAMSKVGVTMDTLTFVSDEVGTVESLFDDIIAEDDIIASSYGLSHPRSQSLYQDTEHSQNLERCLQTGLIYYDNHISSWLPETLSRAVHQFPFLQRMSSTTEYKDESAHSYLLDKLSDLQTGLQDINILDNREVCFGSNHEYQNEYQYGHDCFLDESEQSVLQTKQGTSKWIPPKGLILNKVSEPRGIQDNENEDKDSNVFCADAMEHNVYQTFCLCPQENCMCTL